MRRICSLAAAVALAHSVAAGASYPHHLWSRHDWAGELTGNFIGHPYRLSVVLAFNKPENGHFYRRGEQAGTWSVDSLQEHGRCGGDLYFIKRPGLQTYLHPRMKYGESTGWGCGFASDERFRVQISDKHLATALDTDEDGAVMHYYGQLPN